MSYPENPIPEIYISYEDESEEGTPLLLDDADPVESYSIAAFENPITYHLIHAEVNLPQGKKFQGAKVIGRTKYPNGETVGKYNDNPLFNSMLYDFDFPYGEIK